MARTPLRSADVLATFQSDLTRHRAVLEGWRDRPSDLLTARPSAKSWSAVDCVEHVRRANSMYLRHMDAAVSRAETKGRRAVESFTPGRVGAHMRRTLAPRRDGEQVRVTWKMPTLGAFNPVKDSTPLDLDQVFTSFEAQLDAMRTMGQRLERIDLSVRTKTLLGPLLWLKVGDVVRYLVAHTDRHFVQAERAIETARSSGDHNRSISNAISS